MLASQNGLPGESDVPTGKLQDSQKADVDEGGVSSAFTALTLPPACAESRQLYQERAAREGEDAGSAEHGTPAKDALIAAAFKAAGVLGRAANPFSGRSVWAGEPHPHGHWPCKKRALLWSLVCGAALLSPNGYEPKVGVLGAEGANGAAANGEHPQVTAQSSVEEYCNEILKQYALPEVITVKELLDQVPELRNDPAFAKKLSSLPEEIPRALAEHCILELSHHALTIREVLTKFPHLEESLPLYFIKGEQSPDVVLPLVFIRSCERGLQEDEETVSGARESLAREIRMNLQENPLFRSTQANRILGPSLDKILTAVAERALSSTKPGAEKEDAAEIRRIVVGVVRAELPAEGQPELDEQLNKQERSELP